MPADEAADFYRIAKDYFHAGGNGRADTFTITCAFRGLTVQEQGTFLEVVTTEESGETALYVTLKAQLMDPLRPSRVSVTTRTGPDGKGPELDGAAWELLKATYVRPLRDAEAELRAGGRVAADRPACARCGQAVGHARPAPQPRRSPARTKPVSYAMTTS